MKLSLIGSGRIGGMIAVKCLQENLCDVLMFDVSDRVHGSAIDIEQSVPNSLCKLSSSTNEESIKNSDVIIVSAEKPRTPDITRDGLISLNSKVIKEIAQLIKKYSPDAFVIVITNPLDVMTYLLQKESGLPSNKVVGMSSSLDGGRFAYFLSKKIGCSVSSIHTTLIGAHNNTMLPLTRYSSVEGIPLSELISSGFISSNDVSSALEETRNCGLEITRISGSSAYNSPATYSFRIAQSYIHDSKKVISVSTRIPKELTDGDSIYVGYPVIIGKNGIEKVINLTLNDSERSDFLDSVKSVRSVCNML